MRWWNEPQIDGSDNWVFECRVDENNINPVDSKIFWYVQALSFLIWLAISIIAIISLDFNSVFSK